MQTDFACTVVLITSAVKITKIKIAENIKLIHSQ